MLPSGSQATDISALLPSGSQATVTLRCDERPSPVSNMPDQPDVMTTVGGVGEAEMSEV